MPKTTSTGATAGSDWADVLAEVPLFSNLPPRHVRHLAKMAKVQRLPAYTKIVREGDRGDSFFLILEGNAVVRRTGKRPVRLGAGDFFGELAILDSAPRTATVEAEDEVVVARLGRNDFNKMLEKEPKVALVLLHTLASRLRSSEPSPKH